MYRNESVLYEDSAVDIFERFPVTECRGEFVVEMLSFPFQVSSKCEKSIRQIQFLYIFDQLPYCYWTYFLSASIDDSEVRGFHWAVMGPC